MRGYKKILIAVNGSKEIIRKGLQLATDEGCWVTVVKVLPPYEGDINLVGIRNIQDVLNGGKNKEVSGIQEVADEENGLVKLRLEEGRIHEKIIEAAEDEGCDLIVMGRNRKKGLMKFFGDNILGKVMTSAPCPVLVVES